MTHRSILGILIGFLLLTGVPGAVGEDWPMWRHDPGRTAYSSEKLPKNLHLQWVRQYPPREQVWDDPLNHDLMSYDKIFEPIVMGNRMFVAFNDSDKLVALDIESGRELWRFYADGPIRLAPVAWQQKVFFSSDDGYLYCLSATDGSLRWKFRGGPSERKVLGNKRVISGWPARGGPVIRDGIVYFAASIWPLMGTFIYALKAETGELHWVNDSTGAQYIKQPHSAASFAGVAPQGSLVATKDYLLAPGGRSVPAVFDRETGELTHFKINDGGKGNGGSFVIANDEDYFVHTRYRGVRKFDLKTAKKSDLYLNEPVLGRQHYYSGQDQSHLQLEVIEAEEKLASARYTELKAKSELRDAMSVESSSIKKANDAVKSAQKKIKTAEEILAKAQSAVGTNWAGKVIQSIGLDKKVQWELPGDGTGDIIKAGRRLYAAGEESLIAVDLPSRDQPAKISWSHSVDGRVLRLLAANGKLFAVTLDGRILAFGGAKRQATILAEKPLTTPSDSTDSNRVKAILQQSKVHEGYALCFGAGEESFLEALLAHSELHVVVVDPDRTRVDLLRRKFDALGVYGKRITLHQGEPSTFMAPIYFANLVCVDEAMATRVSNPQVLETMYQSVRPYGGTLWISSRPGDAQLLRQIKQAELIQAQVHSIESGIVVVREGPLPGAADWTHQYGDVANTVKSDDAAVKLPLGVLWFGGNSNLDVLPRHGHGPSEQVVGGRLFIQGMKSMSARDVYTGRDLWKVELPNLDTQGVYYDDTYTDSPLSTLYNQKHIPGANARGANYVATEDAIYLAVGTACQVLSPETGETLRHIEMPKPDGAARAPQWGFIGVYGDILLGGQGFAEFTSQYRKSATPMLNSTDLSASSGLVAFDRHTGQVLWSVKARHGFIHNGIVAGNGRIYCLDRLPKSTEDRMKRRGKEPSADYRLAAFEIQTGRLLWEHQDHIYGTWLGYSDKHDLLLQAGATGRDRLSDEASKGMGAYSGKDGSMVWTNLTTKYTGPCIIYNDLIITTPDSQKTSSGAFNLLDGSPHLVTNPLTGKLEPWQIHRDYGCNFPVASEHLLTFRSGAAGFYDLETLSGTGNFGGFKSGCSPNLIAANGVLNAPDYTRTCSCPYQNQTSLALVHMPDLEVWTSSLFGTDVKERQRITRLGINLGAPGDRRSQSGTLWMDYPSVGGKSAEISVVVEDNQAAYFLRHTSQITGEELPWVVASGVRDVQNISIVPELQMPKSANKEPQKKSEEDEDDEEDSHDSEKAEEPGESTPAIADDAEPDLPPVSYTVRLYFMEPDDLKPGERVFQVSLQNREVLQDFDIVKAAGSRYRGIVKEFKNIEVSQQLDIHFRPISGSRHGPVICGIEMLAENEKLSMLSPETQ